MFVSRGVIHLDLFFFVISIYLAKQNPEFIIARYEIKHTSTISGRDLRGLREYVVAHKARLGLVINNDVAPRLYDDRILGVPFTYL